LPVNVAIIFLLSHTLLMVGVVDCAFARAHIRAWATRGVVQLPSLAFPYLQGSFLMEAR